MASTKISALPVATATGVGDIAPIVQGGVTKQAGVTLLQFSPMYVAYSGGTSGCLDFEPTVNLPVNVTFRWVIVSGSLSVWNLVTGTGTTNVAQGIVQPVDFNSTTNTKVWQRALGL